MTTAGYSLNIGGQLIDLDETPVMGVLNATPDSFYAGSRKQTERDIAERANSIIAEGGSIIDVGAYSTRPGAAVVSEAEEMRRLREALTIVRREQPSAAVSVDTFRPAVMRMAAEDYGAAIINDVSGGNVNGAFGGAYESMPTGDDTGADVPPMFLLAAERRLPYILMSTDATIEAMLMTFSRRVAQLRSLGVCDIILDPGFGFGKTIEQNYAILADLRKLSVMHLPILVGLSRKSMIYRLLGTTPEEALNGTTALHTVALMQGCVSILRVHDVKECVETVKIVKALAAAATGGKSNKQTI